MKLLNLRKLVLINKKFQLSVLAWMSLLGILISTCFYLANFYFFHHMQKEALLAGLAPDNIFFQYIEAQKSMMNQLFLITIIISTVIIFWGGLYFSHRVAGPLYRLTMHLKNFNPSNVEPLKFRKGDYFIEIQDSFNDFIKRK